MKRVLSAAAVGLAAAMALAPSAGAAPVLSFAEAAHQASILSPGTISRSDESVTYKVRLANGAPAGVVAGEKLTCGKGSWTPGEEAADQPGFAFQWLRDGVAIASQTAAVHTVTAFDQGHSLQCRVLGTNSVAAAAAISAPLVVPPAPGIAPPGPLAPNTAGAQPTVEGTEAAARTCKKPASWGPTGANEPTFSFQWLRNGVPIATATSANYTPVVEDLNKVLQCQVIGTNGGGGAAAVSANSPDGALTAPPRSLPENGPAASGPNWTAGTTNLAIALPTGLKLAEASGSGWSCHLANGVCSSTGTVAPGAQFPLLILRAWILPGAPEALVTSFNAYGAGAVGDSLASDSLLLGPAREFRPLDANAGACTEPPVTETEVISCPMAEAKGATPSVQAGQHPFAASASFRFPERVGPDGQATLVEFVRDLINELPAGFVGNPETIKTTCTANDVRLNPVDGSLCPESAAVGGVNVRIAPNPQPGGPGGNPLYRVVPETGYAAAFAFKPTQFDPLVIVLRAKVRSNGDYGVSAVAPLVPEKPTLWGVESATLCGYGAKTAAGGTSPVFVGCKHPGTPGANIRPFLTNPTHCNGEKPVTAIVADTYENRGAFTAEGFPQAGDSGWKRTEATSPAIKDCNELSFEPSFEGRPTTDVADAPSGLHFKLHLPQKGLTDQQKGLSEPKTNSLAEAQLRDTTVVLPEGMTVNPGAAVGLGACSSAQIGLTTPIGQTPPHFTALPDECPASSKIGTVLVRTPLLEKPLPASLYLAKQLDNPFGSLLALYISIDDPERGIFAKLAGKVTPDPRTGQLTTTFAENPQVPLEDVELEVFEGAGAALRTPPTCGQKSTEATFTPWSAPESGPPAQRSDSFAIATKPGSTPGPCPTTAAELPNAPRFSAGTVNPQAGTYSPFVLRLARDDGSQELKGIDATLPPGLTGRLAGVPYCSEAAIAQATSRSKPGEGALEQAQPSCPATSEIGTVEAAAGAGPQQVHAGGRVYLAGPYKGAPVSMVVVTPAIAGPFDLGTVVVRNALHVDPVTAQVSVKSDPIPNVLEGIPLDVRSIEVRISRDRFTLNPTSCDPMAISGTVTGVSSATGLTNRFQVGECERLGFAPKLRVRLRGATKRGGHPALTATLTARAGDANIASASVALPHSEFLEQAHIRTICTRVQFAAHACPAGSIYGRAEAITPLLDQRLAGPVYLRSSSNPLPDLVVALRGPDSQPIEVTLAGRVDSINGGIRNSFELVPDAPVSKFVLRMRGGAKGLLVNSRDICAHPGRLSVHFVAQNAKRADRYPPLEPGCAKAKRGAKGKKGAKHHLPHRPTSLRRALTAW